MFNSSQCTEEEAEKEKGKGVTMAMCKRLYGNKGNFNNVFKKWAREDSNG